MLWASDTAGQSPALLGVDAVGFGYGRAEPGATRLSLWPAAPRERVPPYRICQSCTHWVFEYVVRLRKPLAFVTLELVVIAGLPDRATRAVHCVDGLGGAGFCCSHDGRQRRCSYLKHPVHMIRHDHPGMRPGTPFAIRCLNPSNHLLRVGRVSKQTRSMSRHGGDDVTGIQAGESSTL
jgi:hypothetical protein